MLGRKARGQTELVFAGSIAEFIPEDHILVRVDKVLDLSWLPDEVAECYSPGMGRPGIDPEVAVRLMLAGLLLGIVHDRRLMRDGTSQSGDPLVRRLWPFGPAAGSFQASRGSASAGDLSGSGVSSRRRSRRAVKPVWWVATCCISMQRLSALM